MMLSTVLLAKIAVTMLAVVGLSLIAEHLSARLAGILAGYPHGIAIVLYFIGIEQGVDFAAKASIYAIGGLGANMLLAYVYHRLCRAPGLGDVLLAAAGGLMAFLAFAALLNRLHISQLTAAAITLAMIAAALLLLRRAVNVKVVKGVGISHLDVLMRALLATAIVLGITGAAGAIGPDWSGLLSGFPVVTFPLLLIIHFHHGPAPIATMVKNYPLGLISLLVFTLTVSLAFPALGMNWGTAAGFAAATLYLILLAPLVRKLS